jgi:hypothetical protein
LALSHPHELNQCPLLAVNQTLISGAGMSALARHPIRRALALRQRGFIRSFGM